ncbi:MAG: hypothetical protein MUC67_13600 [Acidobacteria bacterium]|jgi:hypothetical protein|nr:hypothetical protein [Acidobacteriota bacterium]
MSPTTHALVDYWHELPSLSSADRRRALEAAARAVRAGLRPASALLPAALGDPDGDVVRRATAHYVSSFGAASADGRLRAIEEASEWIRRGLALNRAAVFLALFDLGDPAADARLAPLRLTLPEADAAIIWREIEADRSRRAREFLADWRELLRDAVEEQAAA